MGGNPISDSRIMVTTRIENVARACSPATIGGHYIHHMQSLKFEDSRKLILSKAFGSTDADFPKELECVMSEILEKCAGLPLAIVSLASVLAGYRSSGSKHKWETICRSIGSQMDSKPTLEGMKHIVTLSYNHLPYMVKGCMMYLSIFPEDYEVNKDRLLCRWTAEGLIPEKRGLTLMEVAESYLDEMVNRSMIEVRFCPDEYWKAESCARHASGGHGVQGPGV
jgi:disease resistance protein RPM1